MEKEDNNQLSDDEKKTLLEKLGAHLDKSKAELVSEIEENLGALLGADVRQSFDAVATTQQIPGRGMNLDRAHKSALVLLAYVLAQSTGKSERTKT
jgi:hypothetical protein